MNGGIVGVHGVGNYRVGHSPESASAGLSTVWSKAMGRDVHVAYYADTLRHPGQQSATDSIEDVDGAAVFDWVGLLNAPEPVAQGRIAAPIRGAADWVAKNFGFDQAATRAFVRLFFRELPAYLNTEPWRMAARERVAETLRQQQPRVLVAHSLGSVVTYETLWANPDIRIPTLVTVGSPLAMPSVVFERLTPAPSAASDGQLVGMRPPNVGKWCNLADHGDVIAIPRPITDYFSDVDVDLAVDISLFDFHRVANYLKAGPVRHVIAEALSAA